MFEEKSNVILNQKYHSEIQPFQDTKYVRLLLVTKCYETPFLSILSFGGLQLYFRSYANHQFLCYHCFCATRRYIHHKAAWDHKWVRKRTELWCTTALIFVASMHAVQLMLLTHSIIMKNHEIYFCQSNCIIYKHIWLAMPKSLEEGALQLQNLSWFFQIYFWIENPILVHCVKWKKPCQCIILQAMSWPWHFCFSTLLIFFHNIWH